MAAARGFMLCHFTSTMRRFRVAASCRLQDYTCTLTELDIPRVVTAGRALQCAAPARARPNVAALKAMLSAVLLDENGVVFVGLVTKITDRSDPASTSAYTPPPHTHAGAECGEAGSPYRLDHRCSSGGEAEAGDQQQQQ
jgi:hypothetical protein